MERDLSGFRTALTDWFRAQARDLPWRRNRHPYAVLVSELMLQQTQVATVVPYFEKWMVRFPDAATLAAAPEAEVMRLWQGLGYYSRARTLQKAAQKIVADHQGAFPRALEAIQALPGVGRYTAAAIATFAFDQPLPPVDGNLIRVIARLTDFWEPVDRTDALESIWEAATRWQPSGDGAGLFNEALMELGALICTPRSPSCLICPVHRFCAAQQPEQLPVKKPRPKIERMIEECAWVVRGGEVLMEQQTGKRWRGLWKLPPLAEPHQGAPLVEMVYPFTNHRVELSVYPASAPLWVPENQTWIALEDLEAVPMTAPHRRALRKLLKNHLNPPAPPV